MRARQESSGRTARRLVRRSGALLAAAAMMLSLVATASPASAASDVCTSDVKSQINDAKSSFRNKCGRSWNDQKRDQCTWWNNPSGWLCHEHAPNGVSGPSSSNNSSTATATSSDKAASPSMISIGDVGRYNSVVWRSNSSLKGVNVYRNGRYVASVNMPNNVYNDYGGNTGDRYYLVGYDQNGNFSSKSTETRSVTVATSVSKVRWHPNVMNITWSRPSGAYGIEIYRNNRRIATVGGSVTSYTDRNGRGNNNYTIKVVDRYGHRSPASASARQPGQITMRNGTVVTTGQTRDISVTLTSSRTFRGTMTVDPNTGISMQGSVYDRSGNNLGTVTQRHNGAEVVTEADPTYGNGSMYRLTSIADPMELAGGSTYERLADFFKSKPRTNSGDGNGGGGTSDADRQPTGAPGVTFDDNGYPEGDNAGP